MTHAFAYRLVLPIAAVVGIAQTVAAIVGGDYWFDEVYMLAIGRSHLDWGSADQPPLAPALAGISDALFRDLFLRYDFRLFSPLRQLSWLPR